MNIRCEEWESFERLHTLNISRGGLLVRMKNPPELGAALEVRVVFPDGEEISLDGYASRVTPGEAGQPAKVGVKLKLNEEQEAQLDLQLDMARLMMQDDLDGEDSGLLDPGSLDIDLGDLEDDVQGQDAPPEAPDGEGSPRPEGERRAHPRVPIRREVHIRCADWDAFEKLYTVNISKGGLLVRMSEPPAVGGQLEVRLSLPNEEDLQLFGEAARVDPPEGRQRAFRVGVKLHRDEEAQAKIDSYIQRYAESSEIVLDDGPVRSRPEPAKAPAAEPASASVPRGIAVVKGREARKGAVAGLDLGSTFSRAVVPSDGGFRLLSDASGAAAIPSVVCYRGGGVPVTGGKAKDALPMEVARTILGVPGLLGLEAASPHAVRMLREMACPVKVDSAGQPLFAPGLVELTPVEVMTTLLGGLKRACSRALGTDDVQVVVAVPASFGRVQRKALLQAVDAAGLELVATVPEPVAATLAYGTQGQGRQLVGVYDLGGRHFDFSVVSIDGKKVRLESTARDASIGGEAIDRTLAQMAAGEFFQATRVDLRARTVEWQWLLEAAAAAKEELAEAESATIAVRRAALTEEGIESLSVPVGREAFAASISSTLYGTLATCEQALADAGISKQELSRVVLSGGSSRLPPVLGVVRNIFGRDPVAAPRPELAVAYGAAIVAAQLAGESGALRSREPLMKRGRAPRGVGLLMAGGEPLVVIQSGSPLPFRGRRTLSTSADGQGEVGVHVVSLDDAAGEEPAEIGAVVLTEIASDSAGVVELEVRFDMTEADDLSVTIIDVDSGRRARASFDPS